MVAPAPITKAKTIMLALAGVAGSQKELARKVGMTEMTLGRRIQSPENLTLGELCRIMMYSKKTGLDFSLVVE